MPRGSDPLPAPSRPNNLAPAVPVSNATITNNTVYACTVRISGGTVTVISVNGIFAGFASRSVRLESSDTIMLTYSAATNWAWIPSWGWPDACAVPLSRVAGRRALQRSLWALASRFGGWHFFARSTSVPSATAVDLLAKLYSGSDYAEGAIATFADGLDRAGSACKRIGGGLRPASK